MTKEGNKMKLRLSKKGKVLSHKKKSYVNGNDKANDKIVRNILRANLISM